MPELTAAQELLKQLYEELKSRAWTSPPEEIRSGAIISRGPNQSGEEEFCVEANTARGLRKFIGIEEGDPQLVLRTHWRSNIIVLGSAMAGWDKETRDETPSQKVPQDSNYGSVDGFLSRIASADSNDLRTLICDAETLHFDSAQRDRISPILWNYIIRNRDSNRTDVLIAVGSAIRKYVAMLKVDRMGQIATLLEAGHRASVPLSIELEVTKMIYRKFEANPPDQSDIQPLLAERLWEIAQEYMRPRIMSHDKYPTIASLSIQAIFSMRSQFAEQAIRLARSLPFVWFIEMVEDGLQRLESRWRKKNADAADWCARLIQ